MSVIRLKWEPMNLTPLPEIENRLITYTKGQGGVTLLGNGTLLFLTKGDNVIDDAKQALNEARFITDFRVISMKDGGYMVRFHSAIAVFVGDKEFEQMRNEIDARRSDLQFPGEELFAPHGEPPSHILVGLYARGKLQRDAYNFDFYKQL